MVPEGRRAWHAGLPPWEGVGDVNSRSIGIEIANPGHAGGLPPYPAVQIGKMIELALDLVRRWKIRPDRVLGHSDVAPRPAGRPGRALPVGRALSGGRRPLGRAETDPGRALLRLRRPRAEPVHALQEQLATYGYGIAVSGVFDEATAAVVRAFQRHFRPAHIDGAADPSTVETLANLIAARPVSLLRDEELTRSASQNRRK